MWWQGKRKRTGAVLSDPTELALDASGERRRHGRAWYPEPVDAEIGRRLLAAELDYARWTLRRVEKVRFERERSVSREISIDFQVRDDAPTVRTADGHECYLVPLSVMRRRTLVNLALTDEEQVRLPMLGLRLTQQLDESMLLAADAADHPGLATSTATMKLIQRAVAGEYEEVEEAYRTIVAPTPERSDHERDLVFHFALARLRHNFTLYVLLEKRRGRHRILTLAFDEPNDWTLQRSELRSGKRGDGIEYVPNQKVSSSQWWRHEMTARLGLSPIRIRFQVPGAEHAASYHFEATAPHGVRIVRASLLAGRPNEPAEASSWDEVVGHAPSVGLHAVEVPGGSLCRVQLELRVPSRGWFMTLLASCTIIALVMAVVAWHWLGPAPTWTETQVTNVAVILITVSASAATLVAHREFGGLAASMVTGLRMLGVVSLSLPILMAGALVFAGKSPGPDWLEGVIWTLTALALVLLVVVLLAWSQSRSAERKKKVRASPWDMTAPQARHESRHQGEDGRQHSFGRLTGTLGFTLPAVGVPSAEGWHDTYDWTSARLDLVRERLARSSR